MSSTTAKQHPLSLSAEDRARVEEVDQLARRGPASLPVLVQGLDAPSWAVRRAVVSALARLGTAAVESLCEVLCHRRDNEARIAAAVDALVAATGDVEGPVELLGDDPNPAIVCRFLRDPEHDQRKKGSKQVYDRL